MIWNVYLPHLWLQLSYSWEEWKWSPWHQQREVPTNESKLCSLKRLHSTREHSKGHNKHQIKPLASILCKILRSWIGLESTSLLSNILSLSFIVYILSNILSLPLLERLKNTIIKPFFASLFQGFLKVKGITPIKRILGQFSFCLFNFKNLDYLNMFLL